MKTLIITGGTGGLGSTVVSRLSRDYHCVLLHRGETPSVDGFKADLGDETSVRTAIGQAVDRYGAPYGLVHLAGGFATGAVSETSSETWNNMIGLNLTSSFIVVRECLVNMKRDTPGRIIAISSEATRTKLATAAAYTISKTGLSLLIELAAAELAGSAITANALVPGSLDTPAVRKAMPNARLVPLDRVADAIAFLLSDAAASVNGALIPLLG